LGEQNAPVHVGSGDWLGDFMDKLYSKMWLDKKPQTPNKRNARL